MPLRASLHLFILLFMLPVLIESITELEADGFYLGRFKSMDPICLMGSLESPVCLISRMEVERARQEGRFVEVYDLGAYLKKGEKRYGKSSKAAAIAVLADELGYSEFRVPQHYPAGYYQELMDLGLSLHIEAGPLFPERWVKSAEEIEACREGARISEAGLGRVRQILADSEIGEQDDLIYEGEVLTCERLRQDIRVACAAVGGGSNSPIAASGLQAADCHCIGFGAVKAHQMIVVDIFPRDDHSYYYGDLSRTYIKGLPSAEQQRVYEAVYAAHQVALQGFGPGKKWSHLDRAARQVLEKAGYPTRQREDGKWEGCYCGIGHGVGLDIHEPPFIGATEGTFEIGQVVTIEPGLYLPELGGCRIEDTVVITENGYELINQPNYDWVIT